jgi:hypothetical protein
MSTKSSLAKEATENRVVDQFRIEERNVGTELP